MPESTACAHGMLISSRQVQGKTDFDNICTCLAGLSPSGCVQTDYGVHTLVFSEVVAHLPESPSTW